MLLLGVTAKKGILRKEAVIIMKGYYGVGTLARLALWRGTLL